MLYGARANTGLDRMKIINTIAKSIPAPHKVDLSNPEMSIMVEVVKVNKEKFLCFASSDLVCYKLISGFGLQFTDSLLNWSGREV